MLNGQLAFADHGMSGIDMSRQSELDGTFRTHVICVQGEQVAVTVRARNPLGWSKESAPVYGVCARIPDAPKNLRIIERVAQDVGESARARPAHFDPSILEVFPEALVTDGRTQGLMTLVWDELGPDYSGGSPVTGYRLYAEQVRDLGIFSLLYEGMSPTITDMGVERGRYRRYRVASRNAFAESDVSP